MRAGDSLPPSVPLSFSNCFWGKDEKGVEVLHDRMSDAKNICEEIKAFYRERVAAEEDYARKLLKISKMSLGSKECGTLKASLISVKTELEAMGNAHAEVAASMRRELEEAVNTFSTSMKERRKLVQSNIDKLRRTKQIQEQQLQKLKEKYEADCIKINGFLAQQNMLMGKELEKNNTKLEKSQLSVQSSNKDYKAAVKVLHETTHRWNTEWKQACDKYQDFEEERIDFLKSNLWTYANIMSTVCVSDDEACEKIRVSLEKCEVDEVIQSFVQTKSTGQEIPDAPRYRNFYRQEDHDDEAAYKVAQFTRDSNPQYRSSTPQYPHSDDESTMRPMTGMSQRHDDRPMTGMSVRQDNSNIRPMTGMSQYHDDSAIRPPTGVNRPSTGVNRPSTGVSRPSTGVIRPPTGVSRSDQSPVRPATGVPREDQSPMRPPTGVSRGDEPNMRPPTGMARQEPCDSPTRGRPSMMEESPPPSQRSRSRGGSQSPLKFINEYPLEGLTSFCRHDSGSMRHGQPPSRQSSSSSIFTHSEAPTQSTSDSSTRQLASRNGPSPKVLQRRERSEARGSQSQPSPAPSPTKKSHSFWNFGSKSPKQSTPKATPKTSPLKNSRSTPSGMSMSVPSLEIGGGQQRTSPGNHSRRGGSEEPIAPGASVMLNIGNNVLEVNNPDSKTSLNYEEPDDEQDPLVLALKDLKIASQNSRIPSPTKRSPIEYQQGTELRPDDRPIYNNRPPSREDPNISSMRSSTSQNMRSNQTPPSQGSTSQGVSRAPSPTVYDNRRNTLGAPPPAHSAAEMERTRRQYATQVQQVFGSAGRPQTGQMPARSTSPRPTSQQSQYADESYNGRPGSSMSMTRQDIPPRSRSPAPFRHPHDIPPRSRSPAPPMTRPMSRQELEYARPTSRQEYENMRRGSVSPAPYQEQQRGMYDDSIRRSPSPQPFSRAASPGPQQQIRPRSSAAITANNPFGISLDRFGNVVDASGRSVSPQPNNRPRQQYSYGSQHRHDIDERAVDQNRYINPVQTRARTKSQSDLRIRGKYTEDGRLVLFAAKALYDYTAAIPEECSFRKGDVVLVTRTQDDGWWSGEIVGSHSVVQGLVPSNFFKAMQN